MLPMLGTWVGELGCEKPCVSLTVEITHCCLCSFKLVRSSIVLEVVSFATEILVAVHRGDCEKVDDRDTRPTPILEKS